MFVWSAEEKKATKRTFQKIQDEEEEEEDDYRAHYSPKDPDGSGPQLVWTRDAKKGFDYQLIVDKNLVE